MANTNATKFQCVLAGPLPSNYGVPSVDPGPSIGSLIRFISIEDPVDQSLPHVMQPGGRVEIQSHDPAMADDFAVGALYTVDFTLIAGKDAPEGVQAQFTGGEAA